jgi:acyl-CoA dehydrogenase
VSTDSEYVINGRKWWITGAADPRCRVLIVVGRSNPEAPRHKQHSMVLVPADTPGLSIVRDLSVFGFFSPGGHCELIFDDVRVPKSNILGYEGGGFSIAQARLGPGRIHHCMRTIGAAERALEALSRRVLSRHAFGKSLAEQGQIQQWIADARMGIDQARLYTLYTAWLIDNHGSASARTEIAGIKVAVPRMAVDVIDHAIQAHGAGGLGPDFGLSDMYAYVRSLQLADGPDEVHSMVVARRELAKHADARDDASRVVVPTEP